MIDQKAQFFFYVAAVLCFLLASAGEAWKFGGRTRAGRAPALALLPLGLALWLFPVMWNTGYHAFK